MSRYRTSVFATVILSAALWASSCGEGTTEPPPDPPRPTTVTVTPATAELSALGATVQLAAQVLDQYGQVMAGAAVTWSSGDASVAAVDGSGLVTATGNGAATVTATAGSASGTAAVTVAQKVSTVEVSPAAATVVERDTVRFAAVAMDANGHSVEAAEFTWASSDTSVAVVDGVGLVTGTGAGEVEVTATAAGVAGRAALVVEAPVPTTVTVAPDTLEFTALGDTVQLMAEVRDQIGRVMEGEVVAWLSGDTMVAVVDSAGLVTAAGNGAATVTAAAGSASGTAAVTVAQEVSAVEVSPAAATVVEGDTVRFEAVAMDANGHGVAAAEFAWSSSDTSVAGVDASGLVTGLGTGDVEIMATSFGVSGTATLKVERLTPRVTLSASETSVREGGALDLTLHLDPPPPTDIAVAWAIGLDGEPSTADADAADFTSGSGGTVTISSGQTMGFFEVVVNDDADIEAPREVFTITLVDPAADAGYALGATDSVTLVRAIDEGICDRTSGIRAKLLEELRGRRPGIDGCASVTREHLAEVTHLGMSWWEGAPHSRIDSLKARDFSDLENLVFLSLRGNGLRSLPEDIISGLARLESLSLGWNDLRFVPGDVFAGLHALEFLNMFSAFDEDDPPLVPGRLFHGLSNLRELHLGNAGWPTFPAGLFSGLTNLRVLNLNGCAQLQSLPVDLFADLSNLEELHFQQNGFRELPADFFAGLPNLRKLNLSNSPGAPFDIGVRLERTDTTDDFAPAPATVQVVAEAGFPFGFEVPLVVVGGAASPGTLVVAAGAVTSRPFSVSPSSAQDTASVHVSVRLPPIPAGFQGLQLAPPERLVLFKPSENKDPVATGKVPHHVLQVGGQTARVDLAEYFADPDDEELFFSVASSAGNGGVNAEIVGSFLELAPQSADRATLTVAASDPEGLAAWQDIDLTIVPAPNPETFDVDVVFLGARTAEQERWTRGAAERWESIVAGDLPDVPAGDLPPNPCGKDVRLVVDTIDDVIVFASFENIDVAGRGGGCAVREEHASGLAVLGQIIVHFDLDGYSSVSITALHEFGHVLLHSNPQWGELLRNRTNSPDSARDTHFAGPLAIEAFDSAGGTAYNEGGRVPVQSVHQRGFADNAHWRSSVLKGELMNTSGGTNFPCCGTFDGNGGTLSAITVQALADLGYEVNAEEADDYALPGYAARLALAAAIGEEDGDDRVSLDLGNDILRGPVWVVDEQGDIVRILR